MPGTLKQELTPSEQERARQTTVHVVWQWAIEEDECGVDVTRSTPVSLVMTGEGGESELARLGGANHQLTGPANLYALWKLGFVPADAARQVLIRGAAAPVTIQAENALCWNAPHSYDGDLTSTPLTDGELRRAAALHVWFIYYEDRFHVGPSRECFPVAVCFTREQAEDEQKRRGIRPVDGFDGHDIIGPSVLVRESEATPSIGAETVREVLRRMDAGLPGPVPIR